MGSIKRETPDCAVALASRPASIEVENQAKRQKNDITSSGPYEVKNIRRT
jgi:hypothetical protein